jgi:hypothetical protein
MLGSAGYADGDVKAGTHHVAGLGIQPSSQGTRLVPMAPRRI